MRAIPGARNGRARPGATDGARRASPLWSFQIACCNTYWIDEADLLEAIAKDDVKAALVARHERVLADM